MGQNFRKKVMSQLNHASENEEPLSVNQDSEERIIVLSASEYEKFQAESEARMKRLKQELDGILALVQSYTQQRTLEDVEARLVALRKKIEQEMNE